jgi:hypothetical protein
MSDDTTPNKIGPNNNNGATLEGPLEQKRVYTKLTTKMDIHKCFSIFFVNSYTIVIDIFKNQNDHLFMLYR